MLLSLVGPYVRAAQGAYLQKRCSTPAVVRGEASLNTPRFHPACKKRGGRREQRGWTEVRVRGGPQGPDTSPNRREAARREQAQRDSLPLVSSITGGPIPVEFPGSSGAVDVGACVEHSHQACSSLNAVFRVGLRQSHFIGPTISPNAEIVKRPALSSPRVDRRRKL